MIEGVVGVRDFLLLHQADDIELRAGGAPHVRLAHHVHLQAGRFG